MTYNTFIIIPNDDGEEISFGPDTAVKLIRILQEAIYP
jgi:two-component sensor histidine kinase